LPHGVPGPMRVNISFCSAVSIAVSLTILIGA
jgi:hypothetical protein